MSPASPLMVACLVEEAGVEVVVEEAEALAAR
jgi:hypothetical protein